MCVREVEGEQCSTVQCSAVQAVGVGAALAQSQAEVQVDLGRGAGAKV